MHNKPVVRTFIDISVFEQLCQESIDYLNENYECAACRNWYVAV